MKTTIAAIFILYQVMFFLPGRNGRYDQNPDVKSPIQVSVEQGFLILPVLIQGKTYRFLFDTGAIFSISDDLQSKFDYKVVDKGSIYDAERNELEVEYVRVDALKFGEISFENERAFVTDFTVNPMLAALELDGIIGSDQISQYNWILDYENEQIQVFDLDEPVLPENSEPVSFESDEFNFMYVDMNIGKSDVERMKVDYGFNGSICLRTEDFDRLVKNADIDRPMTDDVVKQSGLISDEAVSGIRMSWTRSISIGNTEFRRVDLQDCGTGLIGGEILSRGLTAIDWNKKQLVFGYN